MKFKKLEVLGVLLSTGLCLLDNLREHPGQDGKHQRQSSGNV
jgi:hypothetical protein